MLHGGQFSSPACVPHLQVFVLAAPSDSWLGRLAEAADLKDRGLITAQEFEQLKASLIVQLKAAA